MLQKLKSLSRIRVGLSVAAVGVLGSIALAALEAQQQQNPMFMGGNPSVLDVNGIRFQRLQFPAGVRSNWHSHPDGQLLMLEEGRGLTQDRGRPIREMLPGAPAYTPADVEHWHGASPREASIQWTVYGGEVKWLEPVDDATYNTPVGR